MSFSDRVAGVRQAISNYFEGLNDRERTLMGLMGLVAVGVFVVLPMYLVLDAASEGESTNAGIRAVLLEMQSRGEDLRRRKQERVAVETLFSAPVPPLAGFLEQQKGSLEIREVNEPPDQEVSGFVRKRVQATFPNADPDAMLELLARIERSPFPVTISRIEMDRAGPAGQDGLVKYNFRIGVDAYVRSATNGAP